MSNRAKKFKNPRPNEKPSRAEVQAAFVAVDEAINKTRVILSWVSDLLVEKGVFTLEELSEFLTRKQAEIQEAQCPAPDTSTQPSSTHTTQSTTI